MICKGVSITKEQLIEVLDRQEKVDRLLREAAQLMAANDEVLCEAPRHFVFGGVAYALEYEGKSINIPGNRYRVVQDLRVQFVS